jgi:anti-sigma factor RsiW
MSERLNNNKHVWEELSAYMDGVLAEEEREGVRTHLETCEECRTGLVELRATRTMLRSMPMVPPPRAFTLTQEQAGIKEPAREGFWRRLFMPRNSPRFATGSVLAFGLLLLVVFGDFANINSGGPAMTASAPAPEAAMKLEASGTPVPPALEQRNAGQEPQATTAMGASGQNDAATGAEAQPPAVAAQPTPTAAAAGAMSGAVEAPTQEPPGASGGVPANPTEGPGPNATVAPAGPLDSSAYGDRLLTDTATTASGEAQPGANQDVTGRSPSELQFTPQSSGGLDSRSLVLGFEVLLGLLGTALAFGAVVARRRGL